jgi:hypothetical protein
LIESFHYSILLWCAGTGEFLTDALVTKVCLEGIRGEFSTLIGMKDLELSATGSFGFCLEFPETGKTFIFSLKEI